MIPKRIENSFIEITTTNTGFITGVLTGKLAYDEFSVGASIYEPCPFLEATLEAIPINEVFRMESLVIASKDEEFNVNIELLKNEKGVTIIIFNNTATYKHVKELNQSRNEVLLIKSAIAKQNIELDRLRKLADKANEEKSRFLAMMSHEIRNPLNSILGYGEVIVTETTNSVIKDYANSLLLSGNNLKVIANDILDLSRVEAGKLQLVDKVIDLNEIVKHCADGIKFQNKESEVVLTYAVSNKVPENLIGDEVRITQILSNLLSNAFKFTTKGSISIDISVENTNKEHSLINFSIKDTGRGMSEEQVVTMFNEYEQAKSSDYELLGGAGLGLSIVKRLVILMNGAILIESKLNEGTTFQLNIPFSNVKEVAVSKESFSEQKEIDLEGVEILFADDDQLNQVVAGHILSKYKTKTIIVNDGQEALELLKRQKFDIVLLDINMPNMTGEELMRKKEEFTSFNLETPIFALTANASKQDIQGYLKLGFTSVISKPYTSKELIENIYKTLFK